MIRTAEVAKGHNLLMPDDKGINIDNDSSDKKEKKAAAGIVLKVIGTLLIVLIIASCLTVVVPQFAGYNSYVVASGSMEPAYPVGCMVFAEETDAKLLRMGDVIVFNDPNRTEVPITHRVVSNNPFTGTIITKGDANERQDVNPVSHDNVIGIVTAYVPYIGYPALLFANTMGKVAAVMILMGGWIMIEAGRRLKQKN